MREPGVGAGGGVPRRAGRGCGLMAGREDCMLATDLLSRLTGRVLKDDLSRQPYQDEPRDVGRRSGRPSAKVAPGLGAGRPRPAGRVSSPRRAGSGVDWVTMSDSCHTETTRIGNTL